MVAFCLPGFAASLPSLQARAPELRQSRPAPSGFVSIEHREVSRFVQSTATPAVQEVRAVVDHALVSAAGLEPSRVARVQLMRHYGGRVTETAAPAHYIWWWNGEKWVILCLAGSRFEVDFGPHGTVVVDVEDRTLVN
jgi:hypothetical protein